MEEARRVPFGHGRPGLVVPVRRDLTGKRGPTPAEARGREWRRTSRGFYVPADVERTPEQRIVEAAAVLPSYGGVTGWAALRWLGGRWFGGVATHGLELPVWLATSAADVRSQPGIAVSAERLLPEEVEEAGGVRITIAVRSLAFLMRFAESLGEAVEALDMAAYNDLVSLEEARRWAAENSGRTGIPQMRAALALGHENSWSPPETRMRLIWMRDAGFPEPLCNQPVFDRSGRLVGIPDLLDPVAGVVGEYDGAYHLSRDQRASDVRRAERFREMEFEGFTMTAADLADTRPVVARMGNARRRARWLPESERRWTLATPAWWVPTATVGQRRALPEDVRARVLGGRRVRGSSG